MKIYSYKYFINFCILNMEVLSSNEILPCLIKISAFGGTPVENNIFPLLYSQAENKWK